MLPSDEFARISHFFTGSGMPTGGAVVYCVRIGAGQPIAETAQVCHDHFGGLIVPLMTSDISLTSTLAKEGPDLTGGQALVGSPTYTGTQSTTPAPPQTAVLITKNTAAGGRRNKGRMYLPGLDDPNTNDGGVIASAYVTALQTAVNDFLDDMDASGLTTAVEHSPSYTWTIVDGQPKRVYSGTPPPNPTDCTTWTVQGVTATQRRRQRR